LTLCAWAEHGKCCGSLLEFKAPNVEITKATAISAGTTEEKPWGQGRTAPLPAYCRVEGVMNRRIGVGGEEFGITFALAMPDDWNGDLFMQGGGGSNGIVMPPLGLNATGDTPALIRGFAVLSNDTGHKSHHPGFDFDFMKDQQAYLDFAYRANAEVAALAKEVIAQYYGKQPSFSYFSGCSTGGREGMILAQRFPTAFDGIISGDPAMRTGLSNLAIGNGFRSHSTRLRPRMRRGYRT
jgi:feruloyl esterase